MSAATLIPLHGGNLTPTSNLIVNQPTNPEKSHQIILNRPDDNIPYGLTIRGGIEHGLGHFISDVDQGSEAHLQGIRPGDQIIKCDGMSLHGSTHREAVALISSREKRVILEVISRGAVPIKDGKSAPITWKHIEKNPEQLIPLPQTRPSENLDTRIVISITGQQGLGCSICKGPNSHAGIYVQSTKPGGLAREAGLRPGDQILDCNGISFQRLDFNDAVYQLKSNRHLDLLIRKGAGANLFPSESSGYDSSSSSNAGLDNRKKNVVSAMLPKSLPNNTLTKTTPKPADVSETRLKLEGKLLEEERRRLDEEHEKLKREAQKLEAEKKRFEEERRLITTPQIVESSIEKPVNVGGLANALQNELQKRAAKQKLVTSNSESDFGNDQNKTITANKKLNLTLSTLKNDKHDALMAEFKKAHKKMFNQSDDEEEDEVTSDDQVKEIPFKETNLKIKQSPIINNDINESSQTTTKIESVAPMEKPKFPPPLPPDRTSSSLSKSSCGEESKSVVSENNGFSKLSIPTPDYDTTPDQSPKSNRSKKILSTSQSMDSLNMETNSETSINLTTANRVGPDFNYFSYMVPAKSVPDFDLISSNTKKKTSSTFSKRHRQIEIGSLDSFTISDTTSPSGNPKPPPFYFDPRRKPITPECEETLTFDFLPQPSMIDKNVRFKLGEQGTLAAKDYRAVNATRVKEKLSGSTSSATSLSYNSTTITRSSRKSITKTMAEPKNDATQVTIRSMSDYQHGHPNSMKRITSFPTTRTTEMSQTILRNNHINNNKFSSRKKFNSSSPSLSSSSDEDHFQKNYPRKFPNRKGAKKTLAPPPPPPPLPDSF